MTSKHARKFARRSSTVLAATIAPLLVAGTAYAYWTTSGSGSATAAAGSSTNLTVGTAAAAGNLYPGGSVSGSVVITNPNPFPVSLTGMTFQPATADAGHTGCTTTGVTFAPTTTLPLTIPKQGGTAANAVTVNFSASMDYTSVNGCQGATFTAAYTLAAKSQ